VLAGALIALNPSINPLLILNLFVWPPQVHDGACLTYAGLSQDSRLLMLSAQKAAIAHKDR
jgi:hypothetical protein